MIYIVAILLLTSCFPSTEPIPLPEPTPTVAPTVAPTPAPTPVPVFIVPSVVPRGGGAAIYLCEPYEANVKLYIDGNILLGTFAHDITTGCMKIYYPAFNSVGLRILKAKTFTQEINVIDISTKE